VGKVFFGQTQAYQFNLLPEAHHKMPAMINLQQYYLEEYLVDACERSGLVELRWKHEVTGLEQHDDHAVLTVATPAGECRLRADWVIACDGAGSAVRGMVGAAFTGQAFQDRFLIADVLMKADFPTERWFWFDPPFHPGQSVLLHREADDVWRIDFQLGRDADPEAEKRPEKVIPRIRAMLGPDVDFDLEWVSVYRFACRRIDRLRHGRVLFAGDAAHQVSPFGARGANSGIQDADNLGWKLQLVLQGQAPEALLDSYDAERVAAADENILNSTRSTDFITPKSQASRTLRNAVLQLAQQHAFARKLVNSGRLSVPTHYPGSSLNTPADDPFEGWMGPGAPMDDAPVSGGGQAGWLLDHAGGRFQLLVHAEQPSQLDLPALRDLREGALAVEPLVVTTGDWALPDLKVLRDVKGLVARRYDMRPGTALLLRPDQHVAARWRSLQPEKVRAALRRATCND